MTKKDDLIKTYNQSAPALAEYFQGIGPRTEDIERAFEFVDKKNPKVLEIGCGNGRDGKEILNFTDDYLGMDISEGMIRLAKEISPTAHFIVADVDFFDFPENIDIIFAFASLLHLDKDAIEKVLAKAHKSLMDDGIFYISLKEDLYHEKIKIDQFGERVFYFYEEKDIQELTTKTGYSIVFTDRQVKGHTKWITCVLRKI